MNSESDTTAAEWADGEYQPHTGLAAVDALLRRPSLSNMKVSDAVPDLRSLRDLRALPTCAKVAAVVLAATLLGLIEAGQEQYDRAIQDAPITWGHALIHGLPRWYAWALLLPLVVYVTRRIARHQLGWFWTTLIHVLAAGTVILIQVALFSVASSILHGDPHPLDHLELSILKYIGLTFLSGLATYAVIVGGWYALDLYRRYQERERTATRLELQTSELKALLAESQLERLQAQLEPHFLFNTLHALSSLMLEGDTQRAVRMTSRLSELLRRALQASEKTEHTLAQERDLVGDYLAVQQLRFEDRLTVDVQIDREAADAAVPALLLQPLIENAIVHGIERDPDAGRVRLTAERHEASIEIHVVNDGPPLDEDAGTGVGLRNTRQRLDALYGDEACLELRSLDEGGVDAVIILPYRPRATPTPAQPSEQGGTP